MSYRWADKSINAERLRIVYIVRSTYIFTVDDEASHELIFLTEHYCFAFRSIFASIDWGRVSVFPGVELCSQVNYVRKWNDLSHFPRNLFGHCFHRCDSPIRHVAPTTFMVRSAEITAAHIIRLFLNPLSSADLGILSVLFLTVWPILRYFSVSIVCLPLFYLWRPSLQNPSHSTIKWIYSANAR